MHISKLTHTSIYAHTLKIYVYTQKGIGLTVKQKCGQIIRKQNCFGNAACLARESFITSKYINPSEPETSCLCFTSMDVQGELSGEDMIEYYIIN